MSIRFQTLILILIILVSFSLTKITSFYPAANSKANQNQISVSKNEKFTASSNFGIQNSSLSLANSAQIKKGLARDWTVLDPKISAKAAMVQSLDDNFPLLNYNTYKSWPIASLTKLLTAVVVIEEIGLNKKITVTDRAVMTEGEAGSLKNGEVYTSQDLIKIMLLASSNDAATAFEDYFGGKDAFVKLLNQKAAKIGMSQTVLFDSSGLSDLNQSTTSDLLRLLKYVLEREPEIFNWTRLNQFLVQPINDVNIKTIANIDPLVSRNSFLGGKTGTSDAAGQNFLSIFYVGKYRAALILLGSSDRVKDTDILLEWVEKAYHL